MAITNPEADPSAGLVNLPENVVDPSQQIAAGCQQMADSQFIATGRGGVPVSPDTMLQGPRIWEDLRDVSAFESSEMVESATVPALPEPLMEATSWVRNDRGQVELVAVTPGLGDRFSPSDCNPLANSPQAAELEKD